MGSPTATAGAEANENLEKAFGNGGTGWFEVLAPAAGRDFAYSTGVQHADARLVGKDKPVPMTLRTPRYSATRVASGGSSIATPT